MSQDIFRLATQHHRSGSLLEAESLYRALLVREPNHAATLSQLGYLLYQTGRLDEALELLNRAVAAAPQSPSGLNNLGLVLTALGHSEKAITVYQEAERLFPQSPEIACGLGIALVKANYPIEGIASLERSLALRPNIRAALLNLGTALRTLRRWDESLSAYKRAIELEPNDASALSHLAVVNLEIGRVDEAISLSRRALAADSACMEAHSNLLLMFHYRDEEDPQAIIAESCNWNRKHALPLRAERSFPNDRDPDRKLRIGYVSRDFRVHSVGFFIENLLAGHNRENVEAYCYSDVQYPDSATERLRAASHCWRDVFGLSHVRLAELIRADQIDMLVDLQGHSAGGSRLPVFAIKPAPIQITYLGYPDKTGLTAIDYRFTDAIADPPESDRPSDPAPSGERLVRLPNSFLCFRPYSEAPDIGDPPACSTHVITFGSFNHLAKVNTTTLELWAQILHRVPASRLMLKTRTTSSLAAREFINERFAKFGIGPDRLKLDPFVDLTADHLRSYNQVDIALDAFPYNGTTTTCEALWMGVPVVTLAGQTHVSRVGASLLTNAGYPQWIARTREKYVDLAVHLAADLPALAEIRLGLRARMKSSPLTDGPQFARNVEEAYSGMWRAWTGSNI